jgi:Fe(3+) dicitrate transport protein
MRVHLALALLCCVSSPRGLRAQPAEVHGQVVDRRGAAVPLALIRLERADGDSTRSANDGRFRLRQVTASDSVLHVRAAGFAEQLQRLGADRSVPVRVVLDRMALPLPSVSVIGDGRFDAGRAPGASSVIGPDVLRDRAPISVGDALRTVAGVVTADEDPYGLSLNIGMRGLPPRRSSRTLLLEDGVPILLGPYGDPSMHYAPPLELLERVEVIKGSSQVMNGPQTLAGVVNFVTRAPPLSGTALNATVGGGALGFRNAHLHAGTVARGARFAVDLMAREGDGVREEQHHRVSNVMIKGIVPVGARQTTSVKVAHFREDSRVAETGLTQSEFIANPFALPFAAAGTFDVQRTMAQVVHDAPLRVGHLQVNAFATNTHRTSWRQSGDTEERLGESDYAQDFNCAPGAVSYLECGNQGRPRTYAVAGVEPRLSFRLGGPLLNATVDVGARAMLERARRRQFSGTTPVAREREATLVRDNSIETRAVAGYAQARVQRGAVTATPAIRVERMDQQVRNRFPGAEAQLLPEHTLVLPGIGLAWQQREHAMLFAGVHRGFAPPRPADLYRPAPGQSIVLVNPETSWNWELGGRLLSRRGATLDLTAFRMDFSNEIIEAPAQTGQRFVNGGRTLHTGLEIASSLPLLSLLSATGGHELMLRGAVMHLPIAERRDGTGVAAAGLRLPYAPRAVVSGALSFVHRRGATVGSSVEFTGAQFADAANTVQPSEDGQTGVLPSYAIVHAFASLAVPNSPVSIRLSVRNVLDRLYITQRNTGIHTGVRRFVRAEVSWQR